MAIPEKVSVKARARVTAGLLSSDFVRIALDLHGAEFMVGHNLIFLAVTHGVNSERHF
jgi:hypothetical protein